MKAVRRVLRVVSALVMAVGASLVAVAVWALGPIALVIARYFLVTLSVPLTTPGSLADDPGQVSFGFTALDRARHPRVSS